MRVAGIALFAAASLVCWPFPTAAQTEVETVHACDDGAPDASIAACTALIQSGRGTPAQTAIFYYNRGNGHFRKRERDLAIADYTQAIQLSPGYFEAYTNRCAAHRIQGDFKSALSDCDTAIRLKPDFVIAHYTRGLANLAAGDQARAIEDFTRALQIAPNYQSALVARARAYRSMGDEAKALADLRTAMELRPAGTIDVPAVNFSSGQNVAPAAGAAATYGADTLLSAPPDIDRPSAAEWKVTSATGGHYVLWVRYAAAEARPVQIQINGLVVGRGALGDTTKCWTPDCRTWAYVGIVELRPGENTVRIERSGAFPYLNQLRLVPQI